MSSARRPPSGRASLTAAPELNIGIFAFLLNVVWEFWQAPFYRDLASAPHGSATKLCSLAAVGDVAIMLLSFWAVAGAAHSRAWVLAPSLRQVGILTATGMMLTVAAEWVATERLGLWAYAERMPRLPLLGTGLLPLLQWLILPRWWSGSFTGSSWARGQLVSVDQEDEWIRSSRRS